MRKVLLRRLVVSWLFVLWLLFAGSGQVYGCSADIGDATINEIYMLGQSKWVEIKILNSDLDWADYSLQVCYLQGKKNKCGSSIQLSSSDSSGFPWLILDGVDNISLNAGKRFDVLLLDGNSEVLEIIFGMMNL